MTNLPAYNVEAGAAIISGNVLATGDDPPVVKLEKLEGVLARAPPPDKDVAFLADPLSLPASDRYPLPTSVRSARRTGHWRPSSGSSMVWRVSGRDPFERGRDLPRLIPPRCAAISLRGVLSRRD